MSMVMISDEQQNGSMTKVEQHLLTKDVKAHTAYYNGVMSYKLHGTAWNDYVAEAFPDLGGSITSENIYKMVVDLYAENLVPLPEELRGFSNCLPGLLDKGECIVVVSQAGDVHWPENYKVISDGTFTIACVFTRSLAEMKDYVTFVYSDGRTRVFWKNVPDDMGPATSENYVFKAEETGSELFRFALDDKGFGATLAALQDRLNHSIIDLTVVAEMYARPFWYLLGLELPPTNPFLPKTSEAVNEAVKEHGTKGKSPARLFTTSAEGPFGQLNPPTITDMITYHDSIIDKIPLGFGVPVHYLKPGQGTPPTGVALKVLSKRFNNRIARIREDLEPELIRLCEALGIERTLEVSKPKSRTAGEEDETSAEDTEPEYEYELWNTSDDLLQESLDAHGISLSTMGYPLKYIAEVVTPGVDLDEYQDDTPEEGGLPATGMTDMTAMGQPGTPATPGQVKAYEQNPGQRAKA